MALELQRIPAISHFAASFLSGIETVGRLGL